MYLHSCILLSKCMAMQPLNSLLSFWLLQIWLTRRQAVMHHVGVFMCMFMFWAFDLNRPLLCHWCSALWLCKRETNITHLKRSLQTATSKSIWNQNRLLIHISGLIVNVIPKKWTSKCSNLLHLFPFQVTLWISLTFLTPPLQPSDSILVCNILFSQSNQFLMDNIKSCHTFSLWDMSNCVCEMARKSCYMWTL